MPSGHDAAPDDTAVRVALWRALHVEVDRKDVTGPLELPNTGGWDKWETPTKRQVHLEAGRRVIRVVFDRSATGFVCNFNWLQFLPSHALGSLGR